LKEKYSYLSKNVLLFSLSGFVPKILSFILIPIYTGYLTTAEYGISDLIITTASLLVPIFTIDIQDAVMRFTLDKNYKNNDVFSIAIKILLLGTSLVIIGTLIVSILKIPGLNNTYLLFLVIMYFTTACNNIFSLFCRGIDKVQVIVISSILNSIITLSANILFLVVFKWELVGFLVANSLGAIASLVYIFFSAELFQYIKFKTPKYIRKEMLVFSFPLVFSVAAWWVNSASDRYILSWMAGIGVSGIYAVAYKIPNLLSVFQNVFSQAWSISAIKEFDRNDTDGFIGNMYTMMNFAMVALCSMIMIVNIPMAKILYSNAFFEAWKYVPPLLVSVVFNAMSLFLGSIFTAVKDTKTLSISTIVGAIVNTICNFVLIFYFGAYGASISTLIGYAVTLVMRNLILHKHIHMKTNKKRNIISYIILLMQMIIAYAGWKTIPIQIIFLCGIFILYINELRSVAALVRRLKN
jgi:O-antigen/teichoic acid export membrane protein